MNHNKYINTSLRPYVKTMLNTFKSDPALQSEIRKKYNEEVSKILQIKNNNKLFNKYVDTINIFKKIAENYINKKMAENASKKTISSPKRKVTKSFLNKTTTIRQLSKPRTKLSKKNLHKLLQSNWK